MLTDFHEKRVTVMGLGLYEKGTGIEAVKFFLRHGARVTVTDLRSAKELESSVRELVKYYTKLPRTRREIPRLRSDHGRTSARDDKKSLTFILGKHREEDFRSADLVFQNPSVPADSPYLRLAEKRRIPIVNDWSIFLSRHTPKLFVGVTGTRGKSTTTALIYEMLKKRFPHPLTPSLPPPSPHQSKLGTGQARGRNKMVVPLPRWEGIGEGERVMGKVWLAGNLGVSPLAFIDAYRGEPIVAELSSWLLHHFSGPKKSPNVAVVTNIMNDHMDKYRSMREYIADKENIFRFQKRGDVAVLNADDPVVRKMARKARGRVVWFSNKIKDLRFKIKDLKLLGEHNVANINAAVAVAKVLGIREQHIEYVLETFHGLPGRLELVRTVDGVKYYNDTTATTPEATIAALKTLSAGNSKFEIRNSKRIVLICGGADKKLDYREMAKSVTKYCKGVVVLPGTATAKLRLRIKDLRLKIVGAENMREAVRKARMLAKDGDIVLLSPAAASFGLFRNEFDRGKQFVDAVRKL